MVVIVLLVAMPVAALWALSKSASLRGPLPRPESRKPVEALVTEVIPDERPEDDEPAASYEIETEPPPRDSGHDVAGPAVAGDSDAEPPLKRH